MDFGKLQAQPQALLSQVYSQEIERNESQVESWTRYQDRHRKIVQGIEQLVLELSINCMVPVGKRALMKGKLMHTNEILVCIGDGYFVKYSAQQAIALCNRRIKGSEEILKKLEQERSFLEIRQTLPSSCGAFETLGHCKDIVEVWDEQKLQDWKNEHRKHEKEYRQKLITLTNPNNETIRDETIDDEFFKRLDELELEEELAAELQRLEDTKVDDAGDDDDENREQGNCEKKQSKAEAKEATSEGLEHKKADLAECHDAVETVQETNIKSRNSVGSSSSKRNKISGKFEVSIIKEDDVGKVIAGSHSAKYKEKKVDSTALDTNSRKDIHSGKSKNAGRRVSFADPHFVEMESPTVSYSSEVKDVGTERESEEKHLARESAANDDIKIEFRHSHSESLNFDSALNASDINNPSDIYTIFSKPKSILKVSSDVNYVFKNTPLIEDALQEDSLEENDIAAKSTYVAVVQDVRERVIDSTLTKSLGKSEKNRPVSRFKLERGHQKK